MEKYLKCSNKKDLYLNKKYKKEGRIIMEELQVKSSKEEKKEA